MSTNVSAIIKLIEKLCPSMLAYDWDNVGLLVGDYNAEVNKILVALDATDDVIDEAIEKNCNLIITHHPVIFKPIKNIVSKNPLGAKLIKIIRNNISILTAHTNLDIANGGTNDVLANLLELKNISILKQTCVDQLNKVVTYVPEIHADRVRQALFDAGAGNIGNYSDCSFYCKGYGTFFPNENTNPFIGKRGELEIVQEIRIETIVQKNMVPKVVQALLSSHPYEEVAYDIYPVSQNGACFGIGRIGFLENPVSLQEYVAYVKNKLGIELINVVGKKDRLIKKVALCTGSGSEFIGMAAALGADVFITGDIKFHDAQKALEYNICLIDATHYSSENIIIPTVVNYLNENLNNTKCVAISSNFNGQPFFIV